MRLVVAAGLVLSACGDKKSESAKPADKTPAVSDAAAVNKQETRVGLASSIEVAGTVEVRKKGQAFWQPLKPGTKLFEGDWVRTKKRSSARVRFERGGTLELDESTAIIIEGASAGDKRVAVSEGTVRGVLDKAADGDSSVTVRAKDGETTKLVAGNDKTEFRISTRGNDTEVSVRKGSLKVVGKSGTTTLERGQVRNVRWKPGRVARMLGFPSSLSPGIDARIHCVGPPKIDLSWRRVKNAAGYRVQVASDMSFRTLKVSEVRKQRSFTLEPDEPGMYVWRVAAVDREGRVGEFGFARRIYCQKEKPVDLLVAPKQDAAFAYVRKHPPKIEFSWQSAGNTRAYRLVIAKHGTGLKARVLRRTTQKQQLTFKRLRVGVYEWGVYAIGKDKKAKPIFIKPRKLTVRLREPPKANTRGIWR